MATGRWTQRQSHLSSFLGEGTAPPASSRNLRVPVLTGHGCERRWHGPPRPSTADCTCSPGADSESFGLDVYTTVVLNLTVLE